MITAFAPTQPYCLLVLRTIRRADEVAFVPHLSVSIGLLMAMTSSGVLIYFIRDVSVSIQADVVVARVGEELEDVIGRLFPGQLGQPGSETSNALGHAELPAAFAHEAYPVGPLRTAASNIGKQRTATQDVEFPFLQLVGIAVRTLSPGINNPFTALNAFAHIWMVSGRGCPWTVTKQRSHEHRCLGSPFDPEHRRLPRGTRKQRCRCAPGAHHGRGARHCRHSLGPTGNSGPASCVRPVASGPWPVAMLTHCGAGGPGLRQVRKDPAGASVRLRTDTLIARDKTQPRATGVGAIATTQELQSGETFGDHRWRCRRHVRGIAGAADEDRCRA
jgi:hypothetical protein